MGNLDPLKPEFERLAMGGYLGDPHGPPAFMYLRVSSDEQAEDGASGLPRQLEHCHETALKHGYRVAWDHIYADDCSGFEFLNRPRLTALRKTYASPLRTASVIIIEEIDRLSRYAKWHQGFLLDEMAEHGITPLLWKPFGSEIERSVMGAVAQQGMEQAKARMMEGNLYKARSGRVTARVAAYGYKLVDANGHQGQQAKKDSYYAIYEPEAAIVRMIYQRVISGDAMRKIALDLQVSGIKPPKQYKHWEATQIRLFIRNEIYKGDFYAHRWKQMVVQKPGKPGQGTRPVKMKVERPREEWIHVPVPPLVSAEAWETANRMLDVNRRTSRRNAKEPYLLTGLVRCAHCGWTYTGRTRPIGGKQKSIYRGYHCPRVGVRPQYAQTGDSCRSDGISCKNLDGIVWKLVCQALLEPQVLMDALDSDATSERNRQLNAQIVHLQKVIAGKDDEDMRLYRAYMAEVFDEHEFAARRKGIKEEKRHLEEDLARLQADVLSPEQLEERKHIILAMSKRIQEEHLPIDPPFEVKQRIIKLVVDEITLNVRDGWLELRGALRGTYGFAIESNPDHVAIMGTRHGRAPVHQP